MKTTAILLDDERDPICEPKLSKYDNVVVCRSFSEFKSHIENIGLPDYVAFDFYLGFGSLNGYDAACFMCEHCMKYNLTLPKWSSHSSSKDDRLDIERTLLHYRRFKDTGVVPDVRLIRN